MSVPARILAIEEIIFSSSICDNGCNVLVLVLSFLSKVLQRVVEGLLVEYSNEYALDNMSKVIL